MHLYREVMCISPIRIRNPNYGHQPTGLYRMKDCVSQFINVPCGHCSECVAVRQMSIVQRVQMEELENHIFFCTLTYNDKALPVVTTSTGYDIRYADVSDVQKMIKRIRRHNLFGRDFRYFGVSELGKVRSRPHFHLLFFLPKLDSDDFNECLNLESCLFDVVRSEWRRNLGSTRKPIWLPCFDFVRRYSHGRLKSTFDLHYVNPRSNSGDTSDVAFYVTKYMMKHSDRAERLQQALKLNLSEEEYDSIWKLVKPRWFASLKFGYNNSEKVRSYIRSCIDSSLQVDDSPKFYNPIDGSSFPLSRYYLNHGDFYHVEDALRFNEKKGIVDNVVIDDRHISEKLRSMEKHKFNLKRVSDHDESYLFDDLIYGNC